MLVLVLSPDEQTQSQIGAYKAMTMTATGMSNDLWNKISLHWYHEAAVLSHPQSKICIDVLTRTEVEMWSENSASSRPLLAFKLVERCSLRDDTDLKWTKTKLAHVQNCLFCFTKFVAFAPDIAQVLEILGNPTVACAWRFRGHSPHAQLCMFVITNEAEHSPFRCNRLSPLISLSNELGSGI